ncbi:hypothetical protein SKAU_G00271530 [Synaphobranchus kaupii]|uniref:Uncharacterized protein n=1 Tax=Synaphobranchus kaupii TaxID=118154 RepID=A0A9Q1F0A6_SYNKA|nr:hypothetical protein SKAU_G00271530 [Synaphobranchus kaupii]
MWNLRIEERSLCHPKKQGSDIHLRSWRINSRLSRIPDAIIEEMTEAMFGNGTDQWVCPNDRQLALRAKLQTGWSVHTFRTDRQRRSQALDEQELDTILGVIRRAEQLDQTEQCRIGRLVERLENMRKSAVGNGLSQCLLCGEHLGLLGTPSVFCQDCHKKVCTKCGIETGCSQRRALWLCKICSEQREMGSRGRGEPPPPCDS